MSSTVWFKFVVCGKDLKRTLGLKAYLAPLKPWLLYLHGVYTFFYIPESLRNTWQDS
jgi:hypothetical protein